MFFPAWQNISCHISARKQILGYFTLANPTNPTRFAKGQHFRKSALENANMLQSHRINAVQCNVSRWIVYFKSDNNLVCKWRLLLPVTLNYGRRQGRSFFLWIRCIRRGKSKYVDGGWKDISRWEENLLWTPLCEAKCVYMHCCRPPAQSSTTHGAKLKLVHYEQKFAQSSVEA